MNSAEKVDAVIVGSGAAGSLIAATLAKAGKKVVILEAGPQRRMQDLVSSQIWSRRLKVPAGTTLTGGKDPLSVGFASGWGTGGSALHHYACWFRLHEEDFEMRTRFDVGVDWPMSYADLRPWYDRVQEEVGLSGDAEREVWRPAGAPYPMPPLPTFAQGEIVARGFEKLGKRTAPLPMAINSVPYKGRPACIQDGWCDAGCPIGALANPLATYLGESLSAGAEIHHESTVARVLTTPDGERATGVEYFDGKGELRTVMADVVVLAAYVFEIPRILLQSREGGLANASDMVGRSMMAHTTSNIFGFFEEDTDNFLGRTGGQLVAQDDYAKDPAKGFIGSSSWLIANALKPNDLLGIVNSRVDLFGPALHDFFQKAAKKLATMTFVGESLPVRDNRLTLTGEKDRYGLPRASVVHQYAEDSVKCWAAGIESGKQVFAAAGAREIWTGGRNQMHTMGGAVMGRNAGDSVTNSYGQTHQVPNLFIAGSSLFPTTGGVNPTFTLCALASRSADYMVNNWSGLT
ncbi:MAG: GMC family oxidoreductase [Steroidobacteraceae bacterium]